MVGGAWWAAVHGVTKSRTRLSDFTFTFHFHALEKEMATHSSVLAWRIPGMVEPDGLPSMGSHRVGHDWSDLAAAWNAWGKFSQCYGHSMAMRKRADLKSLPDTYFIRTHGAKQVFEWMKIFSLFFFEERLISCFKHLLDQNFSVFCRNIHV